MSSEITQVLRDVADHVRDLHVAVGGTLLGENSQLTAEHLGELLRELDAAGVGRDHDDLVAWQPEVQEVLLEHRQRGHVVDRHAEEALDLAGMQVHREDAIDARRLQHVRHQTRGDGLARRRFLVLARVREPRHDGGDALRRGQASRVDHDQELDEVVVARARAGLDQEDVGASHRLVEAHVRLGVGEGLERGPAQRDAQLVGDALRQIDARAPCEQHHAAERRAVARAAARLVRAVPLAAVGKELAGAEQAVGH
jgi:hypothetical protein